MRRIWKKTVATGAILVVVSLGGQSISEAAGRISERLTTGRASAAKEKAPGLEAESDAKPGSGLLGNRASSGKGLSARAAKRKEVPAHAKEALSSVGGLEIELGDTVESLDGPALTPPRVPSNAKESLTPPSRSNTQPSTDPRNSRRTSVLKRGEASPTEATPAVEEPRLLGTRSVR